MNKDFNVDDIFNDEFLSREESVIDPEVLENPNIKPVVTALPKATPSFKQPIYEETVEVEQVPGKRKFITKQVVIDKFNTKCVRILLTPSVCDICAFDIAQKYYGSWDGVPEVEKTKVKKAVIEHKRVAHPLNQNLIVSEDEIPKVWLGQR